MKLPVQAAPVLRDATGWSPRPAASQGVRPSQTCPYVCCPSGAAQGSCQWCCPPGMHCGSQNMCVVGGGGPLLSGTHQPLRS
jgi:hypothetical protein